MDLKRKDTSENRAFWESVERAKEEWERIKPDWLKRIENRSGKDGLPGESNIVGWIASSLIVLGLWFVGEKSMWGFVFGAGGNFLWVYVGLKRGKQYDLAFIAAVSVLLNLVGLFKWIG